jgi:hypothetical protein
MRRNSVQISADDSDSSSCDCSVRSSPETLSIGNSQSLRRAQSSRQQQRRARPIQTSHLGRRQLNASVSSILDRSGVSVSSFDEPTLSSTLRISVSARTNFSIDSFDMSSSCQYPNPCACLYCSTMGRNFGAVPNTFLRSSSQVPTPPQPVYTTEPWIEEPDQISGAYNAQIPDVPQFPLNHGYVSPSLHTSYHNPPNHGAPSYSHPPHSVSYYSPPHHSAPYNHIYTHQQPQEMYCPDLEARPISHQQGEDHERDAGHSTPPQRSTPPRRPSDGKFVCECGKDFTNVRNQRRHAEHNCPKLENKTIIGCWFPSCRATFGRPDGLIKHVTAVHKLCTICQLKCNTATEVADHKLDVHGIPKRSSST